MSGRGADTHVKQWTKAPRKQVVSRGLWLGEDRFGRTKTSWGLGRKGMRVAVLCQPGRGSYTRLVQQ